MNQYGKKHPTVGKGLDLYEIMDCHVIVVDDQCVTKIVYEVVNVPTKGFFNSTFYLGDRTTNPLLIKDIRLARDLSRSVAKAFPGRKVKTMTWRESIHEEGERK